MVGGFIWRLFRFKLLFWVGVGSDPKKVQTVYLMMRDQFMTKYKVRKAVVEDNDDIVPLIHSQCTRLKELYGEYYIAEILSKEESESERRVKFSTLKNG